MYSIDKNTPAIIKIYQSKKKSEKGIACLCSMPVPKNFSLQGSSY